MRPPRVAFENPFGAEPYSFHNTPFMDGLNHVMGACGLKPTTFPKEGGNE